MLSSSVPLYGCTTVCLFLLRVMHVWVAASLALLWLILWWIATHVFLHKHMFLFLLGKYLWMELVGHMLILCLIIWGTTQLFAKVVTQFYIPTSSIWECGFLCCWVASVVSDSVQPHRRQPTRLSRPWDSGLYRIPPETNILVCQSEGK